MSFPLYHIDEVSIVTHLEIVFRHSRILLMFSFSSCLIYDFFAHRMTYSRKNIVIRRDTFDVGQQRQRPILIKTQRPYSYSNEYLAEE